MILVCEDDRTLRKLIVTSLEEAGFDVKWCRSEKECETFFTSEPPPELIILDVMMPVRNLVEDEFSSFDWSNIPAYEDSSNTGMRLLRAIRKGKYAKLSAVPIIIYTILDKPEYRTEADQLGVPYFVKGEDKFEKVMAAVRQLTEPKR